MTMKSKTQEHENLNILANYINHTTQKRAAAPYSCRFIAFNVIKADDSRASSSDPVGGQVAAPAHVPTIQVHNPLLRP